MENADYTSESYTFVYSLDQSKFFAILKVIPTAYRLGKNISQILAFAMYYCSAPN